MDELICIVCPNGCKLTVTGEGKNIKVTGNKCPRGVRFAETESTCPMRTVCTTVKTNCPEVPVLPVRVSGDIPKNRIFDVMDALNRITVTTPLKRGERVMANVLDLGVDVIATSDILFDYYKTEGTK